MSTPVLARGDRAPDRDWGRYVRIGLIVAAAAVVVWLLNYSLELDPMALRTWLVEMGPIAPLAYMILYATQVVVAPVPGIPIGAAAGFVFGLVPALLYGTVGLGIGITVALVAGRVWGLRLLARVAGPATVARWEQLRMVNSPITWLLIFLGPSPDLVLFVAGMSRIPLSRLFLIAVVGRAPAMIGATLLGAGAVDAGPWLIVGATIVGVLACCGGALLRRALPPAPRPDPEPAG